MENHEDAEVVLSEDVGDYDNPDISCAKQYKLNTTSGAVASLANMNSHHIKDLLDSHVDAMSKPWKGSIKFKCFVMNKNEKEISKLLLGQPQEIDICDYLCGQFPTSKRLYFDSNLYPPPSGKESCHLNNDKDDNHVWSTLKRELFSSAYELGSSVMSNGSIRNNLKSRCIKCAFLHRAMRTSTAMTTDDKKKLKKVTLVNNRKNKDL